MRDKFGRTINYLRLSITDRCNLRCRYCMPVDGIAQKQHHDILRYEEMLRIVTAATALGIRKVRVTGGEPLVRKGVVNFLRQLATLPGVEEVALTTNGILLEEQAEALYAAGIRRLNISLDSLHAETFSAITRGGNLARVQAGIALADRLGMNIKLNMVAMRGVNEAEIEAFAALSIDHPWSVRFIEYMPIIREPGWQERILTGTEIVTRLRKTWPIEELPTDHDCGPARPYRIAGAAGMLGVITPMTEHFCGSCNRIRITSTGLAKSCLMTDAAIDLRPCLGADQQEQLIALLSGVIHNKPKQHLLSSDPGSTAPFSMASIGG